MDNLGSLKKNFLMNSVLTLSSFIVPVIAFPYVSRVLLPSGVGNVSFATSVVAYFAMFAQLGIPTYGIRAVARERNDKNKLGQTIKEIILINIITCVLSYIAFALFILLMIKDNEVRKLFLILGITLISNLIGAEWIFKGLEKYAYITIRSLIFKILGVIGIFLFVKSTDDYLIYAFLTVFSSIGSNFLNFLNLRQYVDKGKISISDTKKHLKPIFLFFAMTIATTVYTNLDNIMLGLISGNVQVGYYSVAVKVRTLLLSVVTSLGGVIFPRVSFYIEMKMYKNFYDISQKAIHFIFLIALPLSIFFIILSDSAVLILSGSEFLPASMTIKIIMPTVLIVGISNITGIQMLIPLGKENVVLKSVIWGAVTDFILNSFLIPSMNADGAALATLIAEIVVLSIQIKSLGKEMFFLLFKQKWWSGVLLGNFFAMIFLILFLKTVDNMWVSFIGSAIIYFGILFILQLIFRDEILCQTIKSITNRVRKRR